MLKYFYYLRYFLYITWNWNIQLAFFTIYHEVRGERKYGLDTSRLHTLIHLTLKGNNFLHAEMYQGASYFLLENVFTRLRSMHMGNKIVDIGCGKGRALVVAVHYGFNQVTGVDFAEELCKEAAGNCRKLLPQFPALNYQVIHADAATYPFEADMDVIYFFNPFDQVIMQQVLNNILASLRKNPRLLYIIYINPQYKKLFTNAGFTEMFYIRKMEFVEASILKKSL